MYTEIIHIGEGKFSVIMEDGSLKDAGPNICGMIRYVYFEDFNMPKIGWSVKRTDFLQNYNSKIYQDILSGKISKDTKQF